MRFIRWMSISESHLSDKMHATQHNPGLGIVLVNPSLPPSLGYHLAASVVVVLSSTYQTYDYVCRSYTSWAKRIVKGTGPTKFTPSRTIIFIVRELAIPG